MLDLDLSGGGSLQTTFFPGIVRALNELAFTGAVDVLFTVSGGSDFGYVWMRRFAANEATAAFLNAPRGTTIPALLSMLRADTIAVLERRAAWQVHTGRAVYCGFNGAAAECEMPTHLGQAPS